MLPGTPSVARHPLCQFLLLEVVLLNFLVVHNNLFLLVYCTSTKKMCMVRIYSIAAFKYIHNENLWPGHPLTLTSIHYFILFKSSFTPGSKCLHLEIYAL